MTRTGAAGTYNAEARVDAYARQAYEFMCIHGSVTQHFKLSWERDRWCETIRQFGTANDLIVLTGEHDGGHVWAAFG